jgi:hypothetical protein
MLFLNKWNDIYNMFADIARYHSLISYKFSFIYLNLIIFLLFQIITNFSSFSTLFSATFGKKKYFWRKVSLLWVFVFLLALLINFTGYYVIKDKMQLIFIRSIVIPHFLVLLAASQTLYYCIKVWRFGKEVFADPSPELAGSDVENNYFRYLADEAKNEAKFKDSRS